MEKNDYNYFGIKRFGALATVDAKEKCFASLWQLNVYGY